MEKKVPELHKFLSTRKCTNKSGKPYSFEPHDERHEEYNKRGLNLQNINSIDDFVQSFKICDVFTQMKNACLEENDSVKQCKKPPNFEENLDQMRIALRHSNFLSKPEKKQRLENMKGEKLNKNFKNIVDVSRDVRRDNIMKVIRHNSFSNFNNLNLHILDRDEDMLEPNFEDQIKILLACEADQERSTGLK